MLIAAVLGLLIVAGLAALWARFTARQQARMRGGAPDLRRADDGGDPPYTDVASDQGPTGLR
jgi:hypothetical protein